MIGMSNFHEDQNLVGGFEDEAYQLLTLLLPVTRICVNYSTVYNDTLVAKGLKYRFELFSFIIKSISDTYIKCEQKCYPQFGGAMTPCDPLDLPLMFQQLNVSLWATYRRMKKQNQSLKRHKFT